MVASSVFSYSKTIFTLVDQSSHAFSRVEFKAQGNIHGMEMVGRQILVATTGLKTIHLLNVRKSKLALIQRDLIVDHLDQVIADVHTIDNRSFLLNYKSPEKLVVVKLNF